MNIRDERKMDGYCSVCNAFKSKAVDPHCGAMSSGCPVDEESLARMKRSLPVKYIRRK